MEGFLSDLIGKEILLQSGERAGYTVSALVNKKRNALRALKCADGEENEFTLPATCIRAVSANKIEVKGLGGKLPADLADAPVGARVLSDKGKELGQIRDFALEGNTITELILTGGERYPAARLKEFGDFYMIVPARAPRKQTPAPDTQDVSEREAAVTEPAQEKAPSAADFFPAEERAARARETVAGEREQIAAPQSERAGSRLLTGKRVPRDICDVRGNPIIRRGSVITPEILRSALFHNKLFELTVTVLNDELI